ncbi:MAG: TolC family protein [bacterium]|nr:TolC family protein [bacterium]
MAPSVRPVVAIILFLLLPIGAAASARSVTEAEAFRLFLEQSPDARLAPAVLRAASAESRLETPVSNPELSYSVEEAAGTRDEFLAVEQALPITGRRGLARDGADAAASAAGLAAERDLRLTVAELRETFFEVLYRERVSAKQRESAERLRRVVGILSAREREGEGSGYDLLRAEQELAAIEIDISAAAAALAVARARFGAFFDPQLEMESARLVGDLEPTGEIPQAEPAIAVALAQRGDVMALRARARHADLERRSAQRRRFPEPTLSAGWKRTEAPGVEDSGFVAALTVPLPLFDRGQVETARATATLERIELEVLRLEREIRADVLAALAREQVSRRAAERLGHEVESRAAELRNIAELAYDEGEAGILELLDAYRSSLTTELRVVDVAYAARRAALDRDRAIGQEVNP